MNASILSGFELSQQVTCDSYGTLWNSTHSNGRSSRSNQDFRYQQTSWGIRSRLIIELAKHGSSWQLSIYLSLSLTTRSLESWLNHGKRGNIQDDQLRQVDVFERKATYPRVKWRKIAQVTRMIDESCVHIPFSILISDNIPDNLWIRYWVSNQSNKPNRCRHQTKSHHAHQAHIGMDTLIACLLSNNRPLLVQWLVAVV